jgi:hypothetical protein
MSSAALSAEAVTPTPIVALMVDADLAALDSAGADHTSSPGG